MAPMQNRLMVPQRTPLLLDMAPGAAAAFSLRQLSNSYTGPVVTVRRSTDSAEASFTPNEIDNGDLAAWCMGGDGFVKQWWSQTGSNHATQSTAAKQPKIVSSGVVVTEGGKAAVQFDGSSDGLQAASVTLPTYISAFIASKTSGGLKFWFEHGPNVNTTDGFFFCGTYSAAWAARRSGGIHDGPSLAGTDWIGSDQALASLVYNGTGSIYKNGSFVSNATNSGTARPNTVTTNTLYIGTRGGTSLFLTGTISELLIYPRDMTAERQLVEGSMAWYF